jgi:holin-like protein
LSPFLTGFTWLLLLQCVGEAVVYVTGVPIPGPVLGMALLLVVLILRGASGASLDATADGLAKHLSLLFVPAGAGVMLHVSQVEAEWLPITAAIAISTGLAIATTAWTFQWLVRRQDGR